MDRGGQTGRPRQSGPVMDVLPPAGATPSSKPVVTDNQPLQADPMMVRRPSLVDAPAARPIPAQPAQDQVQQTPTPQTTPVQSPAQSQSEAGISSAEPLHKLAHPEAFFGHVGKHKKNKMVVVLGLLAVVGLCAAAYFFLLGAR